MLKSPLGFIVAAAGIILAVSPSARKSARKLAVKGTELLLDLNDKIKAGTNRMSLENMGSRNDEIRHADLGKLQGE